MRNVPGYYQPTSLDIYRNDIHRLRDSQQLRGGRKEDTDDYVSLLKDMRAAFGNTYGISIAIPTSYCRLRDEGSD